MTAYQIRRDFSNDLLSFGKVPAAEYVCKNPWYLRCASAYATGKGTQNKNSGMKVWRKWYAF